MDYQLTQGNTILRLSDEAHIPFDARNRDYREYLDWLASGNEPLPAPEPPAPIELTPAEKLANAGITVDELKQLLGLT